MNQRNTLPHANATKIAACAVTVLSLGLATGCGNSTGTDFDSIAGNLTPNMAGVAERPIDIDRHLAIQENLNWRMASDDLGRVFYTDHPSRLSPWPIMHTSGNPK